MSDISSVIKAIQKNATKGIELYSVIGTATNIRANESLLDVQPLSGALILDVRINPLENSLNGLRIIPKENTNVIVTFINKQEAYLALCDEIESLEIKIGESTLKITDGEVLFNEGNNDGLVKISDLVTKLNNVESDLNNLKAAFTSWVVAPTDGGGALKIATATWAASVLTQTVQTDLEDTKIKH